MLYDVNFTIHEKRNLHKVKPHHTKGEVVNRKRPMRIPIAVAAAVAIIVSIVSGCGNAAKSAEPTTQSSAQRISVTLPSYYAENMVFQRGKPLVIQGTPPLQTMTPAVMPSTNPNCPQRSRRARRPSPQP